MPPAEISPAADAPPDAPGRGWFLAAAVALAAAALAATFTQVYNFDVFWHLAAGRWMLRSGAILRGDPFSVGGEPSWVNVHWLFQVIVAWLHGLGGFGLLSAMKAALAAAVMVVFAASLRRGVPAAWLIVCGLATLVVIETRLRVRPEAVTMLLLMAVIALTESVRRGGPAGRLWLLVPIVLAWVNMHGLYVLGPAVFWSAAAGAAVDARLGRPGGAALASRRAFAPLLAATAACLVSPWPLRAAAQPLLLWTRISGQTALYSRGVSEFLPTWSSPFYLAVGLSIVLPAAGACALNRRRVPLAHVAWLVGFAAVAMLARRNVALTGPVCGYLLALHGGEWLGGLWRRVRSARPALRRHLPAAAGVAAVLLAAGLAAACASEWAFRVRGVARRFGPGLYRPHYPVEIARRLGEMPAGGDVFCENWGDAGTFIYHSRPRRVWMDGRLEAHSLERFRSQYRIQQALRSAETAAAVELPDELRLFYVRALSRDHLTALSACPRFRLLLVDATGACFARTDWHAPAGLSPAAAGATLPDEADLAPLDRPLTADGEISGRAPGRRRGWRQNPPSSYYEPGAMFLWLGWQGGPTRPDEADALPGRCTLLSIRYLTAAVAEGLTDRAIATGMLAVAHQQRALQEDVIVSPAVPLDFHSARALCLYARLDLRRLRDEHLRMFAERHVDALVRARHLDAAERAVAALLAGAPPDLPADKRATYRALHERLADRVAVSRRRARAIPQPQPQRARALVAPDMGLVDLAVAELRDAAPTPAGRLLLGDLLLNSGHVGQAERAYGQAEQAGADPNTIAFRHELCLFVGLTPAEPPHQPPAAPAQRYYRALVREQFGQYESAAGVLRGVPPADRQLARLVGRLRRRLAGR